MFSSPREILYHIHFGLSREMIKKIIIILLKKFQTKDIDSITAYQIYAIALKVDFDINNFKESFLSKVIREIFSSIQFRGIIPKTHKTSCLILRKILFNYYDDQISFLCIAYDNLNIAEDDLRSIIICAYIAIYSEGKNTVEYSILKHVKNFTIIPELSEYWEYGIYENVKHYIEKNKINLYFSPDCSLEFRKKLEKL
ncbi:MAG: hypothetical protein QW303_05270 [Nitrososphaerota archaeon]